MRQGTSFSPTRAAPWCPGPWPTGANGNCVRDPGFRPASPLPSVGRALLAARGGGLSTLTRVIAAIPARVVWVLSLPVAVAGVIPGTGGVGIATLVPVVGGRGGGGILVRVGGRRGLRRRGRRG